jgi:hypothetical protein
VLVAVRQNPKGAVLVLPPPAGGQAQTMPLDAGLHLVHPGNVIEILCTQERAFGKSRLAVPSESAGAS